MCVICSFRGLSPILILIEQLPLCFSHSGSRSQSEDPSLAASLPASATQTARLRGCEGGSDGGRSLELHPLTRCVGEQERKGKKKGGKGGGQVRAEDSENGWAMRTRASERGRGSACIPGLSSGDAESLQAHIIKRVGQSRLKSSTQRKGRINRRGESQTTTLHW